MKKPKLIPRLVLGAMFSLAGSANAQNSTLEKLVKEVNVISSPEKERKIAQQINNEGLKYIRRNEYEKAIAFYQGILKTQSDNLPALNNMGCILRLQNRLDEALNYFDRALTIEPSLSSALSNKAQVLYALGKHEEARKFFDRAIHNAKDSLMEVEITKNKIKAFGKNSVSDQAGDFEMSWFEKVAKASQEILEYEPRSKPEPVRQVRPEDRRLLPKLDPKILQPLPKLGPILPKLGPILPKLGPILPKLGPILPKLEAMPPKFEQPQLNEEERSYFPLASGNNWEYIKTVNANYFRFFGINSISLETIVENGKVPIKYEEKYTVLEKNDDQWKIGVKKKTGNTWEDVEDIYWKLSFPGLIEKRRLSEKKSDEGLTIRTILQAGGSYQSALKDKTVLERMIAKKYNERVAVPAGSFEDCIKNVLGYKVSNLDDLVNNKTQPIFDEKDGFLTESFYSKNVGLIKETQYNAKGQITYTLELKSFETK